MKIIPAILTSDLSEAREMISRCEGVVDRVQIDVIDGIFADNKTVDPQVFFDIETDLKLDFHLMVKEPVNWVEKCVRAHADRIIGHIEHMSSQEEFIGKVQEVGLEIGLGVDIATAIEAMDETLVNSLDTILVMSVRAGFGGQEFDERALSKIEKLNEIRSLDVTPFTIMDDGGVTLSLIDDTKRAGVDEVVIGRRLFDGDLKENIERFLRASYR